MTTPTPSPEAEALPTLPVVAWLRENKKTHDVRAVRERNPNAEWAHDFTALTPHAPAEAAIVALRAEVERLTMRVENLSAEGRLAYKVSENVGRNALQCAQDLLQDKLALTAEVAELRKDAERYRWLRAECEKHGGLTIAKDGSWGLNPWSGDDPDRAIDTARASTDEGSDHG